MRARAERFRRSALLPISCGALLACFVALGLLVGRGPDPPALEAFAATLLDRAPHAAWYVSAACIPAVLAPLVVALLFAAWRAPAWRRRVLWSVASLIVSWLLADGAQRLLARPRRLDWVIHRETAFSYPSSHAAVATGFYLLWAILLACDRRLPAWARAGGCGLLGAVWAAVLWSRLALGAHYPTDLAGGILLGGAVALAGAGVLRR